MNGSRDAGAESVDEGGLSPALLGIGVGVVDVAVFAYLGLELVDDPVFGAFVGLVLGIGTYLFLPGVMARIANGIPTTSSRWLSGPESGASTGRRPDSRSRRRGSCCLRGGSSTTPSCSASLERPSSRWRSTCRSRCCSRDASPEVCRSGRADRRRSVRRPRLIAPASVFLLPTREVGLPYD